MLINSRQLNCGNFDTVLSWVLNPVFCIAQCDSFVIHNNGLHVRRLDAQRYKNSDQFLVLVASG
jgi:hypothetical protein